MKRIFPHRENQYWIVVGKRPAKNPHRHSTAQLAHIEAERLAEANPGFSFKVFKLKAIFKKDKAPELVEGQPSQGATAGLSNAVASTC